MYGQDEEKHAKAAALRREGPADIKQRHRTAIKSKVSRTALAWTTHDQHQPI